jgi:LPS sulfotransferase NodH
MAPQSSFLASLDDFHEAACRETALSDFGDPSYLENLECLLRCYDAESQLGEEGRASTRATLVGCLKSRLYTNDRLARRPECSTASLERPLLVMGLARTGTTALHKLLAADPHAQALEYWLGCAPDVRPPREEWPSHPGYRAAAAELQRIYAHSPQIESIHSMQPGEADECRLLFMQDFLSHTFSFNATIPSYESWLFEHDMRASYLRYRDNLRLIGAREPGKRWTLKNSSHLWAMEALLEAIPDCRLVQTHRNPVEFIASISSLVYHMRRISEPEIRKEAVGRQQLDAWARILEMNMISRKRLPNRVFDIHFETFSRDPIGTLRRIYEHFDLLWTLETERNVRAWAEQNRKDQHGAHRYSALEYGIREDEIVERFRDYIEWETEIRHAG